MISKSKRVFFGLFGIYLVLLTLFYLSSGVFQFINTIHHYIFMGLIGPDRISYGEYAPYAYLRFSLFISVAVFQIIIGGMGLSCMITTPSEEKLRTTGILFCILAFCMIARGIIAGAIGIMTFMDIPQAILFFIFAKQWGNYQRNLNDIQRVHLPFFRFFRMNSMDET